MNLARTAGAFYVVTIVAGLTALLVGGPLQLAANAVAAASYVVVTVLFYLLFKPVGAGLSLVAAAVSLAGCAAAGVSMAAGIRLPLDPLVCFGVYCLLIGWLISRSTLPRVLGLLMAFGGLGWLTFAWPPLARALAPLNYLPGIIGETALTLWLLATGARPRTRD